MHSLLSLLQGYRKDEIEVRGLIVSFKPETERLLLYNRQKYVMTKMDCERYYKPLCMPDFTIYYVGVPDHQQNYMINFDSLLI